MTREVDDYTGKFKIRGVVPRVLRDLVVLLSRSSAPLSWKELTRLSIRQGACIDRKTDRPFSNSRMYHHTLVLRCMGFVHTPRRGLYAPLSPFAPLLAAAARFNSDDLAPQEALLLADGLFRCPPTREFLTWFVTRPNTLTATRFPNQAIPINITDSATDHLTLQDAQSRTHTFEGKTEVNRMRWGIIQLCLDIGLIDRLKMPLSSNRPSGQNQILFPIQVNQTISLTSFRQALLGASQELVSPSGRIYIPDLMHSLCTSYTISTARFKELLKALVREEPSRFYLEKTSSTAITGFESSFLKLNNTWRATLVISPDSGSDAPGETEDHHE